MAQKTLAELQAEMLALKDQIEQQQVAPMQAIIAATKKPAIQQLIDAVTAALPNLTEERAQQASNIMVVLQNSPTYLQGELDRITAPAPEEPAPEEPAPEEPAA